MRISLVSSESLDTQRGAVYRCCRSTRDLGLMQGACELLRQALVWSAYEGLLQDDRMSCYATKPATTSLSSMRGRS